MGNAKTINREMTNDVRREFARHAVNTSEVQVSTSHGVIHLFGRVRPMRGREGTFESDLTNLLKALRQKSGIRDVIAEWTKAA
jgi:hypothetical protein